MTAITALSRPFQDHCHSIFTPIKVRLAHLLISYINRKTTCSSTAKTCHLVEEIDIKVP